MNRSSTTVVVILIACAALLAIAGPIGTHSSLVYIFKPLATFLILGIALLNWISQKQSYAFWVAAGLACSLVGDVLLMWPENYFVAGLGAFLLAHVGYLVAFTREVKFPASWMIWIVYLGIGAGTFFALKAHLPAELKLPAIVYAFAVTTMAAQAMGRYLLLPTGSAGFAAAGGIFFLLSDGLLAVDRFHAKISYGTVAVLVPYYVAQVLIALSTRPDEATRPEAIDLG